MGKSKAIGCYNCKSTILYLPEEEIIKFNGLNFLCENCGHYNLLKDFTFLKGFGSDTNYNICINESLNL